MLVSNGGIRNVPAIEYLARCDPYTGQLKVSHVCETLFDVILEWCCICVGSSDASMKDMRKSINKKGVKKERQYNTDMLEFVNDDHYWVSQIQKGIKEESDDKRPYVTDMLKIVTDKKWFDFVDKVSGASSSKKVYGTGWKKNVQTRLEEFFKVKKNIKRESKKEGNDDIDEVFGFMRCCRQPLLNMLDANKGRFVDEVLLKFVEGFDCGLNIGDGDKRVENFNREMNLLNLDGEHILDQVSYTLMGEKVLGYWDSLEQKDETDIYAGVTSLTIAVRAPMHVQQYPTAVLTEIMGLMKKEKAAILEWAAIRQMKKLIEGGMVRGGWNESNGIERLTYGRDIEEYRIYFAKATTGVNPRQAGVLRVPIKKVGKKDGEFYSLNEGVAVAGQINNVDSWMQNRVSDNVMCEECGKVFSGDGRLKLHMLGEHSKFEFKCGDCGVVGNVVKLLGHKCFLNKF